MTAKYNGLAVRRTQVSINKQRIDVDINHLTYFKSMPAGEHINEVCKVKKKAVAGKPLAKKNTHTWFFKSSRNEEEAFREVVTQELFRLLANRQPKTRLVCGELSQDSSLKKCLRRYKGVGIISKEIDHFWPFDTIFFTNFIDLNIRYQRYQGLGEICVLAIFLAEADLHSGNIGVDSNYKIVKIDGGRGLSSLDRYSAIIDYHKYPITSSLLDELPNNENICGWFGFNNINKTKSYEHVRHEINQTILKIITLPKNLIEIFFTHYHFSNTILMNAIKEEVFSRQEQMLKAAMQNKSFLKYLNSDQKDVDLAQFIIEIKQFQTIKKQYLCEKLPDVGELIHDKLNALRALQSNQI